MKLTLLFVMSSMHNQFKSKIIIHDKWVIKAVLNKI